jgi:archaemetzincin
MRTLHVAIHETGHMFGIKHCIGFECCMNGSNSLFELDRQENRMCHECLAKVCWNRAISPGKHVQAMLEFYSDYLPDTSLISYYRSAQECLKKP